jgi:hypothetical protein
LTALVADANASILARQRAVKGWPSIKVPGADAPACPSAPEIKTWVDGFGLGSSEARKSMVILTADEIAGRLDSSLDPSIAKDLAAIDRAGRGVKAPLEWATIDYTTDEFPFKAGPRGEAFQYALAEYRQRGDAAALEKGKKALASDELVIVAEKRVRVRVEGSTFTPGSIAGVALLWSYSKRAVVCADRFEATTTSDEFRASKDQVKRMPEEEVEVNAFRVAAATLRKIESPAQSAQP